MLSAELLNMCRANAQQPKLFVGMILILIFAEALALYGLIVGIILASKVCIDVAGVTFVDQARSLSFPSCEFVRRY